MLKNDIVTMYNEYVAKHEGAIPGIVHTSRSLFYTIVKHITDKQQEVQAGVDYIKVNFLIDNFSIVHKVINALAPQSDVDHTLHAHSGKDLCDTHFSHQQTHIEHI